MVDAGLNFRPNGNNGHSSFFEDVLGPPPAAPAAAEDVKPSSAAVAVVRPFPAAEAEMEEPERGKWLSKGVFLRAQAAWKKGPLTYDVHMSSFGPKHLKLMTTCYM